MSSIEERLLRDIAAVTQGVVVTESDLRDARNTLEDRIEIGKQRERRRGLVLAAAAAVVIPIVGIVAVQAMNDSDTSGAPSGQPSGAPDDLYAQFLTGSDPTVDLVTGVWRQDNGYMLVRFQADGTVQFNDSGGLFGHPSTTGTYEIQGDHLTITTTRDGTDGADCAGTELALRASVPETGAMRIVNPGESGPCFVLATGARWALEQTLPTLNEGMASYAYLPEDGPFEPVTKPGALHGDWLAVGGGHMLELLANGSYTVAGDNGDIVDRGRWTLDSQDLQLTSGPDSPTCDEGARLVLGQLTHADPGSSEFLRGTTTMNMCAGAWAKDDWYLIPNNRSN